MSRRTVSWLIGGGVALVALLALATTAPLVQGPLLSVNKTMRSDANESEAVTCANITFTATITYSVRHPLVDLWGFRTINDATIDPAALNVKATGECGGPVSNLGGAAYVQTESCPVDIGSVVATALATTSWGSTCDNTLTYYSAINDGAGDVLTHTYSGPSLLASSGFGRGSWCPAYGAEARYSAGSAGYVLTATTVDGDLCLDLS